MKDNLRYLRSICKKIDHQIIGIPAGEGKERGRMSNGEIMAENFPTF